MTPADLVARLRAMQAGAPKPDRATLQAAIDAIEAKPAPREIRMAPLKRTEWMA